MSINLNVCRKPRTASPTQCSSLSHCCSKPAQPSSSAEFDTNEFRAIRAKTENEIEFLEQQFALDPSWNRKTVQTCKRTLTLRTDQIYKWGYDRKKLVARNNRRNKKLSFIPDDLLTSEYQKELSDHGLNGIVALLVNSAFPESVQDVQESELSLNDLARQNNQQVIKDVTNEDAVSKGMDKTI